MPRRCEICGQVYSGTIGRVPLSPLSTAQASAPSIPSLGHMAFNVAAKAAVDSEDALHALASVEIPGFRNRLADT